MDTQFQENFDRLETFRGVFSDCQYQEALDQLMAEALSRSRVRQANQEAEVAAHQRQVANYRAAAHLAHAAPLTESLSSDNAPTSIATQQPRIVACGPSSDTQATATVLPVASSIGAPPESPLAGVLPATGAPVASSDSVQPPVVAAPIPTTTQATDTVIPASNQIFKRQRLLKQQRQQHWNQFWDDSQKTPPLPSACELELAGFATAQLWIHNAISVGVAYPIPHPSHGLTCEVFH